MSPTVTLLSLLVFPIIGTSFGWRYIIAPFGYHAIKWGWKILTVVLWTGFWFAFASNGFFYRDFGVTTEDISISMAPTPELAHQYRWDRENSTTPEGKWDPNWRQHRGLEPLPANWDGPVEHAYSPLVFILAAILVGAALYWWKCVMDEARGKKRTVKTRGNSAHIPTWRIIELEDLQDLTARLGIHQFPPEVGWSEQELRDFNDALRGLGFKMVDIKRIRPRIRATTLESRIVEALHLLTPQAEA